MAAAYKLRQQARAKARQVAAEQAQGYKSPRQDIVSPSMLNRAASEMRRIRAAESRETDADVSARRAAIEAFRAKQRASDEEARERYRVEKAARAERRASAHADVMARVEKALADADARAFDLRHRGRPASKKRLPPLALRGNPDALIAAVSNWHGER